MDAQVRRLVAAQQDLIAAWQLCGLGWSRSKIRHWLERQHWQVIHDGVYALTLSPLTRRQRWIAATLTAPKTFLSHSSAGACWGFRPWEANFETVLRAGSGGPRQTGALRVFRSTMLVDDTGKLDRIPITTAERTLVDLASSLSRRATAKAFREAIRLKTTTTREIAATLGRHRGRRGTRVLKELTDRYSGLPYSRCRSDAESRALELLHDAGIAPDDVNRRIAGEEADLIWVSRRRIIEIDGPQYHQFRDEDVRKQDCWERAGYLVSRLSSTEVFNNPSALIALALTER